MPGVGRAHRPDAIDPDLIEEIRMKFRVGTWVVAASSLLSAALIGCNPPIDEKKPDAPVVTPGPDATVTPTPAPAPTPVPAPDSGPGATVAPAPAPAPVPAPDSPKEEAKQADLPKPTEAPKF